MEDARQKEKRTGKSLAKTAGESSSREKLQPPTKRRKEGDAFGPGSDSEGEAPSRQKATMEEKLDFLVMAYKDLKERADARDAKEISAEDGTPSKGM